MSKTDIQRGLCVQQNDLAETPPYTVNSFEAKKT